MKISASRSDAFVRNPGPEFRAVLVYGPNGGLVRERADRLAAGIAPPGDPFRSGELEAAAIRADPARLHDEAQALSLGGGRRVVRVREATDALAKAFEAWLAAVSGGSLVVAEAGDLGKSSALRKLFEAAANAAALPCYADEKGSVEDVVRAALKSGGLSIEPAALDFLLGALGEDRMLIRGEAEKLVLYARNRGRVTVEDVEACVGDSGAVSLEAVALAVASGDADRLERALERAYRAGVEPVAMLRATAVHLRRLHLVAGQIAQGAPEERALASLRPPLFFKIVPEFRRQLRLWTPDRLAEAMERLAEAEKACKTTGNPAEVMCARALMGIAGTARATAA